MPYPNMPKSTWSRMERCVADVKAKGGHVNAYAVCYSSIMGEHKKKNTNWNKKAIRRVGK
jgi:hypothetical protein